jgi:hypothetical protein
VQRSERHVLAVRELALLAVGLVGGGDHDPAHARASSACLQECGGAADVRVEGLHGVAIRDRHDRLGSEVKDELDLVVAERSLDQALVPNVAEHDGQIVWQLAA